MQNIQNYLLCLLYLVLLIVHSQTICRTDFHQKLISIFSFALFTETLSTIFETIHQLVLNYGRELTNITQLDLSPVTNFHYSAQLLHITAMNFFILFLLIIAKGWPITRRDMSFKYAFAIFWIVCLAADLITYYWTTITVIAKNFTNLNASNSSGSNFLLTVPIANGSAASQTNSSASPDGDLQALVTGSPGTVASNLETTMATNLSTAIIESLPNDQEQFNTTPRRLSLLLRIIIMIFFLLELRSTMILEQEKKKLQFYLNFGALTMVWFVHTLIVYIISLRVDSSWQSKLISGFSSAANFLGFAVTTRLLWPRNSRSYLFRKHKHANSQTCEDGGCEIDNLSTVNDGDEDQGDEDGNNTGNDDDNDDGLGVALVESEYDGLEMRDLSKTRANNNSNANNVEIKTQL